MKRLSFRKKILLGQLVLFAAFVLSAFPFIKRSVQHVIFDSLRSNSYSLIGVLQKTHSQEQMVHILADIDNSIFYGVALFDQSGQILYDSALGSFTDEKYAPFYPRDHQEVLEALKKPYVYSVGKSNVIDVKLAYVIMAFEVGGKTYILRTSFSFAQVEVFTHEFEFWC